MVGTHSVYAAARTCLHVCEPMEKVRATRDVHAAWERGALALSAAPGPESTEVPGRPSRPRLVTPRALPRRGLGTVAGRAALMHAVAHIEFNAINLAWDAVYRFRDMPRAFFSDWMRVALEEAKHFELLCGHVRQMGYDYGDFDAHNGLWEMAVKTAHDPLVRMALVPRVLEARGLDVTPGMIGRLRAHGDARGVSILELILAEEIGHVAIGSRWYRHLCAQRSLEPEQTFRALLDQYKPGRMKGPLNQEARLAAGFSEQELKLLSRF